MMELQINNLSKTYPNGVQAVKNATLNISTGMFGLLGPNGAGKSTLMRIIATLQEADTGTVVLKESAPEQPKEITLDVLREKEEVRKILGYLPQEFGLYPNVTAQKMLEHIASLKGISNPMMRKEVVEALLQKVNLYPWRRKNLGTFSGGMKQRFGIAQALLGNPKLIIVDEPTAGLDPNERNRFHNLLSEIGENTIVVLSTHIVEDVSRLCNNMAIICEGEVVSEGKPIEILRSVEGKTWMKTIEKRELDAYKRDYQVISVNLFAGKTVLHIFSENDPGDGFQPAPSGLEDVYFLTISQKIEVDL